MLMAFYFRVAGVEYPPPSPDGGVVYTEQPTRGVAFKRYDGHTVTRAVTLTLAQRIKTGRLVVGTSAQLGGILTTAELATLLASLEGASTAAPVRIETNTTRAALDGFFVLEPGSTVGHTALGPQNEDHAWSATLLRVS
jgi:hypothetical protein